MSGEQKQFDWGLEGNRRRLEAAGLSDYERRLLLLVWAEGERHTRVAETFCVLTISNRMAGKKLGGSAKAAPRAAARLARRRIRSTGQAFFRAVVAGQTTTYEVWQEGLNRFVDEPVREPQFGWDVEETGTPTGTGRDASHTCNRELRSNSNRVPVEPKPWNREPEQDVPADGRRLSLAELLEHGRPWRMVEDGHLRALDRRLVETLFRHAVSARWLQNTPDDRLLFYGLAFQAATTTFGKKRQSRNPRVATLRSNLQHRRAHFISDEARQWAKRAAFAAEAVVE